MLLLFFPLFMSCKTSIQNYLSGKRTKKNIDEFFYFRNRLTNDKKYLYFAFSRVILKVVFKHKIKIKEFSIDLFSLIIQNITDPFLYFPYIYICIINMYSYVTVLFLLYKNNSQLCVHIRIVVSRFLDN